MSKDVKIELIYFKTKTDFSLEFGLHGNYPMRMLSNSCDDLRTFFKQLKRAVSRSEIIITVGGYNENCYIPDLIGNSIGRKPSVPDYKKIGILTDKAYRIPSGSVPLASDRKLFGGFLTECGPQAIISLCDDRDIMLNIVENTVAPYIAEHYSVFGNRYIAPASKTDGPDTLNSEESVPLGSFITDKAEEEKSNGLNTEPMQNTVSAEDAQNEIIPEVLMPDAKVTVPENSYELISAETGFDPGNAILSEFNISDIDFPEDADGGYAEEDNIRTHFNWLRILSTVFIILVVILFAFLYAYFGIYIPEDKQVAVSYYGSTPSNVDFNPESDVSVPTVVIGNDDVSFNDTRSENEELFEQGPVSGDENDYPLPVPIPIPVTSETSKTESKTSSATSSEAEASSNKTSVEETSGEPSTASEASSEASGTPSSTSSASEESKTSPSQEPSSENSSVSSQTSQTPSSDISSVTSVTSDPGAPHTEDPMLTWHINITVYNSKTSTYVTGTATEIVEMITEAEISSGSPPEALKAQAAAAYSWLITNGAANGKKPTVPLNSNVGQRTKDAVAAVKGTVISYNGYFAETYYSAYSAGHTANYQDVWQDGKHFPYLQSVECPVDEKLRNFETVKVYTADEIKTLINEKLKVDVSNMPKSEWIVPISYDTNGLYCIKVRIGGIEKTGAYFRSTFLAYGIRSTAFKVVYSENDDTFTFTVRGWGHGVGMSQDGACAYAKDYGWTYLQILEHFYPGVTITKYC